MGTGLGLGIGIPFRRMGAGIDAQAQAHYNRVIADGGLIPSGLVGVNNFFKTVKGIYGTSDITTAISVGLDAQVLGYKLGAGAGTTAGQAAQKLYSCSGSSGDVVQTTAASQPLLLVHSGANYWFTPNGVTNNCSTPNATANQITGDYEVIARCKAITSLDNFGGGKYSGTAANCGFWWLLTDTDFFAGFSGNTYTSSLSNKYSNGVEFYYKITRLSSTGTITLTRGTDGVNFPTTMATLAGATGAMPAGSVDFLATQGPGVSSAKHGYLYRMTVSNSIGGAPVVDFNPNSYNAATSQTQWTSSTGEVWTINTGTATSGYKGALVSKTIVQGDGIDDTMVTGLTLNITSNTRYSVINPYVITSGYMISGALGGSGDRHLTYISGASVRAFSGSNFITYIGVVESRLQLLQATFNAASSQVSRNNSNNVTGTIDINNIDNIRILSATGSSFKNMNFNTLIETSSGIIDNSTIRTAMYNYIRSINNNAF
jgi:hypothetical protein